jgi:hypothetical protein
MNASMSRGLAPSSGLRLEGPPRRARLLAFALGLGAIIVAAPRSAHALWGPLFPPRPPVVRTGPPDQSWLLDVPEKPGAHARGKVAVFVFKGDDVYEPMRAQVVKILRHKGLNVTANLRPVDTAAQFKEMSVTLNMAAFVEGDVRGDGAHQTARIRLRSGMSGQPIAAATFSGPTAKIVGDINKKFWTRVGPSMMRACAGSAHPRRLEREPLRIDAGSSGDSPVASDGL